MEIVSQEFHKKAFEFVMSLKEDDCLVVIDDHI